MFDKLTNIAAQEAFGEAVNTGNFGAFDQLVAADSVDHDPAPEQQPGPEGYKAFFGQMRTAFPDMHLDVDTMIADDDRVAFDYTLTGTHQGPSRATTRAASPSRSGACRSASSRTAR